MGTRRKAKALRALAAAGTCAVCTSLSLTAAAGVSGAMASPASASPKMSVAAGVAYAKAQIAQFSKLPTFKAPGAPFNTKKLMKGKMIFSIPLNSSDQFDQVLENGMEAVAKKVGFKFDVYNNAGQPSQWVAGMNAAVTKRANLIDLLSGNNPVLVAPQITAAKKAGIPTVASDAYSIGQKGDPAVDTVDVPYGKAARLMADWAIANSNGHADALIIESSDAISSPFMLSSERAEFKRYCPACKVSSIDIPVADWASETQSQVEAKLSADPHLDYVMPVYDSESQFIVPAITTAHRVGKVHIISYDGTPFVLKMMETGNIVQMDVGEDLDWVSKAIMDDEMRIVGGLKPVANEGTPLYIFSKHNVARAGTPPKNSTGYGTAYISGYYKLWGLG
ncbi:MAG: sugar ABC transporter substrate-binding protein [Acidimicrobiales bacterium]